MALNPNGTVAICDGGTPRNLSVVARQVISGGAWVLGSTAHGVVGSGTDTYVTEDITGYTDSTNVYISGALGLALQTTGSNDYVSLVRRGEVLLPVGSATASVSIIAKAGDVAIASQYGGVLPWASGTALPYGFPSVGKILSTGSGNSYVVVSLNL
jgi:hypothetical protein